MLIKTKESSGVNTIILTKRDLKILPHFYNNNVPRVLTISQLKDYLGCTYENARLNLIKLEKRGLIESFHNLHLNSIQKYFRICLNITETINEML